MYGLKDCLYTIAHYAVFTAQKDKFLHAHKLVRPCHNNLASRPQNTIIHRPKKCEHLMGREIQMRFALVSRVRKCHDCFEKMHTRSSKLSLSRHISVVEYRHPHQLTFPATTTCFFSVFRNNARDRFGLNIQCTCTTLQCTQSTER